MILFGHGKFVWTITCVQFFSGSCVELLVFVFHLYPVDTIVDSCTCTIHSDTMKT